MDAFDPTRFETMRTRPLTPADERKNAQKAADDFEQMFVRTLVGSLRATSKIGDEGGMFGSGPGTDTYGDWFDQNLAEQVGKGGKVGIAESIMRDWERHEQIPIDQQAGTARLAADRAFRTATNALGKGGVDVVR